MERIGVGREAEVYALGETECLKLFFEGVPESTARREAECMALARRAGAPAPESYGTVRVDGRWGLRMERLRGPSMLKAAVAAPGTDFGEPMGRLHHEIHQKPGAGGTDAVLALEYAVRIAEGLTDAQRAELRRRLPRLERGDRLLHLDYHLDNIIVTSTGLRVIDWPHLACGSPLLDAAMTLHIIEARAYPPEADDALRAQIDARRARTAEGYLRGYGLDRAALAPWEPFVCAIRIPFGPPEEKPANLERIARALEMGA